MYYYRRSDGYMGVLIWVGVVGVAVGIISVLPGVCEMSIAGVVDTWLF